MVNILRKALIAGGLVAMLGCGDDSNNCEVRESEGCEDFTGLYKVYNFQEFFECTRYPNSPEEGSPVVEEGPYFSFKTYEDCSNGIVNHDIPVVVDSLGNQKHETYGIPCDTRSVARGNHLHLEYRGNSDSGHTDKDFMKCGHTVAFSFTYLDYNVECLALLEPVVGEEPYTSFGNRDTWPENCECPFDPDANPDFPYTCE